MFKYVCIHCGNVNLSYFSIGSLLADGFYPSCSFCGAGFMDLFDFNDATKDFYCSEKCKEGFIKIDTYR